MVPPETYKSLRHVISQTPPMAATPDGADLDVYEAACTLYYMRHTKLDPSAASNLAQLISGEPPPRHGKTLNDPRRDPIFPPRIAEHTQRAAAGEAEEFPPEWLRAEVGRCCMEPLEKRLHKSDVKDNQNRLCMTKAHVRAYFTPLLRADERPEAGEGVAVTAYDWRGKKYQMKYRIWGDDKNHVLIGGWKNFFHDHDLEAGKDTVTVWMFRHRHTDLLSALITYRRTPVAGNSPPPGN